MNLVDALIQIILIAVSYYLFSNEFFLFAAEIKKVKISLFARVLSFLMVFVWFITASLLELPLDINWLVFLIILGLEVYAIFKYDLLTSYALAMFCVITGLSVNVLFRSIASIIMNVPLIVFDKVRSPLKTIPILLGFLFMAVFFFCLWKFKFTLKVERMINNKESLSFYARTEVYIYVFLLIQLLVFTQYGSTMGIKIWGVKSAIFSAFILIIAIIYSLRVASLHYYMDRHHETREHLIQEKRDINKLWKLAYTDVITGCSNRQLLDKRLEEYAKYGGSITLAFIDINGLKNVNDKYGHVEGDNYLTTVSETLKKVTDGLGIDLFRYGGDEFVLMSNKSGEKEISQLLAKTNILLKEGKQQYTKSVSYGVVQGNATEYLTLLAIADDKMYHFKWKYYQEHVRK